MAHHIQETVVKSERQLLTEHRCLQFVQYDLNSKAVMLLAMKTRNVIGAFRSVYCHRPTVVYCQLSSRSLVVRFA